MEKLGLRSVALSQHGHCIFILVPPSAKLLSPSILPWHRLSHLSSSSTTPKAAAQYLPKMPGHTRQGDGLGRRMMAQPL